MEGSPFTKFLYLWLSSTIFSTSIDPCFYPVKPCFHILKIEGQSTALNRVQIRDWKFDLILDQHINSLTSDQQFLAFKKDYPKLEALIMNAPFHQIIRLDL